MFSDRFPKARDLVQSGKRKIYRRKKPQGALQDLQRAAVIAPEYYEAYYRIDDAETTFHKSIEVSAGKSSEAEVGLRTFILSDGNASEVEKAIRCGVALSPDFWLEDYE